MFQRNHDVSLAPTLSDSFATTLSVEESPEEVFAAVLNVRGWWSENIDGSADRPGAIFTYHHRDVHRCTIRVSELANPMRVAWQVVENHFNFTHDADEWTGTEIRFDIARNGSKTELRFTHLGLVRAYECFDVCSGAWDFYLQTSMRGLIRSGRGLPNPLEQPAR